MGSSTHTIRINLQYYRGIPSRPAAMMALLWDERRHRMARERLLDPATTVMRAGRALVSTSTGLGGTLAIGVYSWPWQVLCMAVAPSWLVPGKMAGPWLSNNSSASSKVVPHTDASAPLPRILGSLTNKVPCLEGQFIPIS